MKRVVSLFSGIGGFEVGLRKADFEIVMICDTDPHSQAVLKHHFPDATLAHDVTQIDSLPDCDVLVAGWPCQDLSQAGRMAGHSGLRSGLVAEIFRLVGTAKNKPETIILENVAFALNLQGGVAISIVTQQLESLGYHWAYRVLNTANFGLPQRRRRIYIVASLSEDPKDILFDGAISQKLQPSDSPTHIGFYWTEGNRGVGWTLDSVPPLKGGSGLAIPSPPAIWSVGTGEFLTPGIQDAERLQGFPQNWTLPATSEARGDRARWKLVGNAVSVPVVSWLAPRLVNPASGGGRDIADSSTELVVPHNLAWGSPNEVKRVVPHTFEGPSNAEYKTLEELGFLDSKPLSLRAAKGFLSRYKKSALKKNAEFIDALNEYCENISVV